ncbi:MAG TPA: hypothetical protein VFV98_16905 [Vicinamibacterales bacterium]|nr:hypothetical protein [Vicinamibacterales bacterium]
MRRLQVRTTVIGAAVAALATIAVPVATRDVVATEQQTAPAQQAELSVTLSSTTKRTVLAVADFVVPSGDADAAALSKLLADVLWADFDFEREYSLVPRAKTASLGAPARPEDVAQRPDWGSSGAGADAVVIGTVTRSGKEFSVKIDIVGAPGSPAAGQIGFSSLYEHCALANPRFCSHSIADDIHKKKRGLDGVARTRLAFSSDRDSARMSTRTGVPVSGKEIYVSDYDGANQQRFTFNNSLNIHSRWSPNGNQIVFTSYQTSFPDIYVANLAEAGRGLRRPGNGNDRVQNNQAAWSPDGSKIAYVSNRSGNYDIWIANADGGDARNLTNHPAADQNPTWSPNGQQIAFTSDRATGSTPQLYLIGISGQAIERLIDQRVDRPTWSTLGFIAFTSGSNFGHDISLLDLVSRQVTVLTDGKGDNGSPAVSPSGRHIAFTTSRWGKDQIAIVDRRGSDVRQITNTGNNTYPSWQPIR